MPCERLLLLVLVLALLGASCRPMFTLVGVSESALVELLEGGENSMIEGTVKPAHANHAAREVYSND
jgi:hypothetical protein